MSKKFTVTTPIYYVNGLPHIGTSLTTLAADVVARYQTMQGKTVHFMVGTDENATKVYEYAQKLGKDPKSYVDEAAEQFKTVWKGLNIQYTDFIRTTEDRHTKAVHALFDILKEKGYVYEGVYEGWYDISSETFYKESELVDGKSPEGNPVKWVQETNWFFKLSAFAEPLLDHIQKNPDFILPHNRANEVISFIQQGLRDVCMTRINQGWGIPVPGEPNRVFYVWFDALINYIASCGWPQNPNFEEYWPCEVQWMGKDILTRFHATLWPAMLMGAGLPLPKHLVGHGWILMGGEKVSKSKGNVVAPLDLAEQLSQTSGCQKELAIDAIRYYLAACLPLENDGLFTNEEFEKRYNSDLANDFGNALNRSLAMLHKFAEGKVPHADLDPEVVALVQTALKSAEKAQEAYRLETYTSEGLGLIRVLNKYIDVQAPWVLSKNNDPKLGTVLRSMLYLLRNAQGILTPVMPTACAALGAQLGLNPITTWEELGKESIIPSGTVCNTPQPLFPRIDPKKVAESQVPKSTPEPAKVEEEFITIQEFAKLKLRVGTIIESEEVEGSKKLLKFKIDFGNEVRQILSGIKMSYSAQEMIGKQVIAVVNLKPVKIMGLESQGMVLSAIDEQDLPKVLTPEVKVPSGAIVG